MNVIKTPKKAKTLKKTQSIYITPKKGKIPLKTQEERYYDHKKMLRSNKYLYKDQIQ